MTMLFPFSNAKEIIWLLGLLRLVKMRTCYFSCKILILNLDHPLRYIDRVGSSFGTRGSESRISKALNIRGKKNGQRMLDTGSFKAFSQ